jgi:dihydrofolate synthase/folylpolyglutamate synthase
VALPPGAQRALDDLARFGVHLGLDHVRRLFAAVGDPQRGLPTVVVAGTNGKGSTAALLAAMAREAGYRTGLYTSPHLVTVEERVQVDGAPVGGEVLGEAVLEVLRAAGTSRGPGDGPPTYFEALTAAALLVFRRLDVELAVLEVGLGGRLDAVNAAEPLLSVVTPVSLEHRDVLGDDLATIAGEKAGVLRGGRPAVAWGAEPEVRGALARRAGELGCELSFADDDVEVLAAEPLPPAPWSGQRVELATPRRRYELTIPLAGAHQAVNLALAVRAAEELAAHGWPRLDAGAVVRGAAAVRWPGRLEVIELEPSASTGSLLRRVLLDAAHNPQGAESLAAFLDLAQRLDPAPPPALLFGVLTDKDAHAMLPPLAARSGRLVLTRPPSPRARDPKDLLPLLDREAAIHPEPTEALNHLLAHPGEAETLLVCGSIYLVGHARAILRSGTPSRPE